MGKKPQASNNKTCPCQSSDDRSHFILTISAAKILSMSREFYVESFISPKELNNQSVSLVIPRITRDRIHTNVYYKCNLGALSLRGDSMLNLSRILIRDFGKIKEPYSKEVNASMLVGGPQFKCLLMKVVELRPTIEQLRSMLELGSAIPHFEDKYICVLLLVYGRIQYYYLTRDNMIAKFWRGLFMKYITDYRKLKIINMHEDCWSQSQNITVSLSHIDEIVDWLATKNEIWGIPLGRCQWSDIYNEDYDDESSDDSSSDDGSDS